MDHNISDQLGPSLPTSLLIIGAVGGGGQLIGMAGYEGCFHSF
jgi:hypothetical protein